MSIPCHDELQKFLEHEPREYHVVVMPDFFLDRLVNLKSNMRTFFQKLEEVANRKGGSIDGIAQTELRGGNAINTASALASLGAKVTPIACTDKLGSQLIKFYLKPLKMDLTHVKILERASITTAIELTTKEGKANIMLRDVGSLADFGPQHLTSEDFEKIEEADYVCVFNWAGTRRFGTELAEKVFQHTKTKCKGKTYYDTADPNPNKEKIPELTSKLLQNKYVDIFSVNENEAISYASQLSATVRTPGEGLELTQMAEGAAKTLAANLSARVDLHTTSFSATFTQKRKTIVRAFPVHALRVTGAGDAWNAGNIVGDADKLSDKCRLTLANAVAAYYISHPRGDHPTRKQLAHFLKTLKHSTRKRKRSAY